MLNFEKINESYSFVENSDEIKKRLTVKKSNIKYNWKIQAGIESEFLSFYQVFNNKLVIPNGMLDFLTDLIDYNNKSEFDEEIIKEYINNFKKFELRDYQYNAVLDSLSKRTNFILAATNAGKSIILSLIIDFLVRNNLKVLLIVPNILLLKQFSDDIDDYNLNINRSLIGDGNVKNFENPLIISTWQSLQNLKDELPKFDAVLVDEAHGIKGDVLFDLVLKCSNAKFKIGCTGTLPENQEDVMKVLSCFGKPKNYITPKQLIERGFATRPIINVLKLNYNFDLIGEYSSQLKKIKEYKPRNEFLINLVNRMTGNTLLLFQHTQHGIDLFNLICSKRNLSFNNKSYKSLEFQKYHKIYFINGVIDGNQRDEIRKILENETNAILVANYACLSTGANIPNLHNLVLGSPLKSYISISQSIGRLLRKHNSKSIVKIYDIHDNVGYFKNQFKKRYHSVYEPQDYEVIIRNLNI